MKCFLLQKVPFRLPGKRGRMVWGVVVGRSRTDGVSLIYVRKPQEDAESSLVAAIENPQEQCFEAANQFVFRLGDGDLGDIGGKLRALGEDENESDVRRLFEREDQF